MNEVICIYHGNCCDGFGAAWAFRELFGEAGVTFHHGVHGEAPPNVTGKIVYILDFSYKYDVLLNMAARASQIVIIDHHKSAREDLLKPLPDNVQVNFDMERSGAMMTWDYFNATHEEVPKLIEYIQDRDLWRFQLAGSKEVSMALFSYPYDFDVWSRLMTTSIGTLISEGTSIQRKLTKDVLELIEHAATRHTIGSYNVPVLNVPYMYASEAGHIMSQGEDFAATWYETDDQRIYSLRSADDGIDVSVVATEFGGGGHEHAAGFKVAIEDLLTVFGDES